MAARAQDPCRLDVAAFARDAGTLEGRWPLGGFARLLEGTLGAAAEAADVVWSARGEQRAVAGGEPQVWLHLDARTAVMLTCQRCLQPIAEPLAVHTALRFVAGEERAESEDEASEEDVLALRPALDLRGLIEDELILALPLVPRHADCELPLPAPAAGSDAASPFAVLERLRRDRSGTG